LRCSHAWDSVEGLKLLIIALDGLEHDLVVKFGLKGLMQAEYGRVDLSLIKRHTRYPSTLDVWSTFLAGRFRHRIASPAETFLRWFTRYAVIGLPGFMRGLTPQHRRLVDMLVDVLARRLPYARFATAVKLHTLRRMHTTLDAFRRNPEVVVAYFPIADLIGHLFVHRLPVMRRVYGFIDRVVAKLRRGCTPTLIVSDHGMAPWSGVKRGEHSWHGYYSINRRLGLDNPKIEDFPRIIRRVAGQSRQ